MRHTHPWPWWLVFLRCDPTPGSVRRPRSASLHTLTSAANTKDPKLISEFGTVLQLLLIRPRRHQLCVCVSNLSLIELDQSRPGSIAAVVQNQVSQDGQTLLIWTIIWLWLRLWGLLQGDTTWLNTFIQSHSRIVQQHSRLYILHSQVQLYLTDDVGRQVKQAEGVSFVPRVQHAEEMGNVVSAVTWAWEGKILQERKQQLQPNTGILIGACCWHLKE